MLKLFLVLVILAWVSDGNAQSHVYGPDPDGDTITLTAEPCDQPVTTPESLRLARIHNTKTGSRLACWGVISPDQIGVLLDGNRGWRLPMSQFRRAPTT